jgi:hypothetical protein
LSHILLVSELKWPQVANVHLHTHTQACTHTKTGQRAGAICQWFCLIFGVGRWPGFRENKAKMKCTKPVLNDYKQITGWGVCYYYYLFWVCVSYSQTTQKTLENHIHLVLFFLLFRSGEQSPLVCLLLNWSLESPLKPLQWHSVSISQWCRARISVIDSSQITDWTKAVLLPFAMFNAWVFLFGMAKLMTYNLSFFLKLHKFLWIWLKICSLKMVTRQAFPSILFTAHGLKLNYYEWFVYFWKSRNSLKK